MLQGCMQSAYGGTARLYVWYAPDAGWDSGTVGQWDSEAVGEASSYSGWMSESVYRGRSISTVGVGFSQLPDRAL